MAALVRLVEEAKRAAAAAAGEDGKRGLKELIKEIAEREVGTRCASFTSDRLTTNSVSFWLSPVSGGCMASNVTAAADATAAAVAAGLPLFCVAPAMAHARRSLSRWILEGPCACWPC